MVHINSNKKTKKKKKVTRCSQEPNPFLLGAVVQHSINSVSCNYKTEQLWMIRAAYIDISVTAHATFSDRLEISQNVEFFFSLRGSPDWSTGRKARQFRPNKYRHKRRCPLWVYFCVHTRAHAHNWRWTEREGQDGKNRRHPGGTCSGEEKGQRERLSPLWLSVVASEQEVTLELEEQEVLILLEESFKVQ